MVSAWATEDPGPDDLPMTAEALVARSKVEIMQSNDQGRALCAAFLREAAAG
jgi:hypothetical protein